MSTMTLPTRSDLADEAERQLHIWALGMESKCRLKRQLGTGPQRYIQTYVAISREAGIDADRIADRIAAKLGWNVFHRELLDFMANQYDWPRIALDYVDEETAYWFQDTLGKWLDARVASSCKYAVRQGTFLLIAAQHESHVFVGRGAQFILPREAGLCVRLIAPKSQRIRRVIARGSCEPPDADRFIDEIDRARANAVRRYYSRDASDPRLYDLTINLENTSLGAAENLILGDYLMRFEPHRVRCEFQLEADRSSQRL